jgi:cellulose biosynthesis protein BcsQ
MGGIDHRFFQEKGKRSRGLQQLVRERTFAPELDKSLRRFSTWELAELILRVNLKTLQKKLLDDEMPKGILEGENTRHRWFSLEEVNQIRSLYRTADGFTLRPFRPKSKRAMRVAVSNFKGGSGKSTTALHFAHAAALEGYKVLVVDFDPQATLSHAMGVVDTPEERTVWGIIARDLALEAASMNAERAIMGRSSDKDRIQVPDAITGLALDAYGPNDFIQPTCWPTIDIVASCANAAFVEFASGEYRMRAPEWSFFACVDRFLDALPHDEWDLIIFDNPPAIGYQALNALFAADIIYVPFGPAYWEYDSTTSFVNQLGDALEEVSTGFRSSPEIGAKLPKTFLDAKFMLTRYDASNSLHREMLKGVRMAFGDAVTEHQIEATRAVEQSGRLLRSIYEIDYRSMTRETWKRARHSFDGAFQEFLSVVKKRWTELPDVDAIQKSTEVA